MSLEVIKFVAGGGKTTYSKEFIRNNTNVIYLAFNNKVIDMISSQGFLSKTIDSLFVSFLIPKLIPLIPIITDKCEINYCDPNSLNKNMKGVSNIHIDNKGNLFNKTKKIGINLKLENYKLHNIENDRTNIKFLKYIFSKNKLNLTDQLREELCSYIICEFSKYIKSFMEKRFSYIIIDEAQDLFGFREEFAKLISESKCKLILLGDDNQNINRGGRWFNELEATKFEKNSFRCPEENCKWIRDNIGIDIFGNNNKGGVFVKTFCDIDELNDCDKTLLYTSLNKSIRKIVENWKGPKLTIKKAKGQTIDQDVVVIGKTMNSKNLYTAITRTTKIAYITVKLSK